MTLGAIRLFPHYEVPRASWSLLTLDPLQEVAGWRPRIGLYSRLTRPPCNWVRTYSVVQPRIRESFACITGGPEEGESCMLMVHFLI